MSATTPVTGGAGAGAGAGVQSAAADALEGNAALMDLYSRQIGTFGVETMAKLIKVRALIIGVKGVGVELAKNLVLAGPKQVTLLDTTIAEPRHQNTNFFLSDADLGRPIAEACMANLSELNSNVAVKVAAGLSEELVAGHDIVIFTEGKQSDLVKYNNFCRNFKNEAGEAKPIAFLSVFQGGCVGSIFTDFGPNFTIADANGEQPVTRVVTCIKDGVAYLLDGKSGGQFAAIDDNDHDGWVTFADFKNLDINGKAPVRVHTHYDSITEKGKTRKRCNKFALDVPDIKGNDDDGGVLTQVKKPYQKSYKSLAEILVNPGPEPFTDGAKFGRFQQLHVGLQAVYAFQEKTGFLPRPNNEEDVAACVKLAGEINEAAKVINESAAGTALVLEEVQADVISKLARHAAVQLQPLCAFFGGVVAQEVVKIAGKYTPIDQILHMDWFEALPATQPEDTKPLGSRYDDNIAMFGKAFQDKIAASSTFLVGCGALGCEFLKNFALLGLATNGGTLHTTDNDSVEVSNLNRQFLFRTKHVGKLKSEASAESARIMNPAINIKPYDKLVWPKTEDFFNDAFWESLSFVTNALDNVKARRYVDDKCVFYYKALLESGTLGVKSNSQVVVPGLTQSYSDGPADAEDENEIPMCTLRNFPSLIDHCIEWARAQFQDRFVQPAVDAERFVESPSEWLKGVTDEVDSSSNHASAVAMQLPKLRAVRDMLDNASGCTFETCVNMAVAAFCGNFRDRILNLIRCYPKDHRTSDGDKFWSGAKRFPRSADLDLEDELHLQFVISAANLLACNFNLCKQPEEKGGAIPADHEWRKKETIAAVLAKNGVPKHVPSGVKIATEGNDGDTAGDEELKEYEALMADLGSRNVKDVVFTPADFEKDHDWNFHIDFIHAASNLRAWNYEIKQATRHSTKMIAGKIIPAIATTTASVTGLVMVEMLKLLQGKDKLEDYRNSSNSLGINSYLLMEPAPPVKAKPKYDPIEMEDVTPMPAGFTKWDKTLIDQGDLTITQFREAFKKQTSLNVESLSHRAMNDPGHPYTARCLWPLDDEKPEWANVPLRQYIEELYAGANPIPEGRNFVILDVSCTDDDDAYYIVPTLYFKFK